MPESKSKTSTAPPKPSFEQWLQTRSAGGNIGLQNPQGLWQNILPASVGQLIPALGLPFTGGRGILPEVWRARKEPVDAAAEKALEQQYQAEMNPPPTKQPTNPVDDIGWLEWLSNALTSSGAKPPTK